MYYCGGACKGVSPVPTNCGAESCELAGKPLEAVVQCDPCTRAGQIDNQDHACDRCEKV